LEDRLEKVPKGGFGMQALSMDLRKRVVGAYDAGEGKSRELAKRFGVSDRWIRKLLRQRRETNSIAPKQYRRGPKPKLSGDQRERLVLLARQQPDLTLDQLRRRLRLRCSIATVWRALDQAGFTFKRRPFKLANKTAPMSGRRVVVGVAD
jgi:transposase